jgi:uncharacterized protein (DUF362 family)
VSKPRVSIVKTDPLPRYPEILTAVRKALGMIDGVEDIIKPGQVVLINPSWVAPPVEREAGCITLPEVPRALADIVKELGARPIIAESSAVGVDTEKLVESSGYGDLREMGYEVINLEKTPTAQLHLAGGKVFQDLDSYELVKEADVVISVPKLKTHDQTEMTCAIKKLKGLLTDKGKRAMHRKGLFEGVVDLMAAVQPKLAVVDAIICQEGVGPIFGKPVEMDLILAGKDLVAVDSVCARLIGYTPWETLLTVNAAARGLGVMDPDAIQVVGESLDRVKRRFLRSIEDDPVQVEGFNLIQGEITCTGCRNTVLSALIDMRNADQLMYLPGITVITGGAPAPRDVPPDRIVTVGICVPQDQRSQRHVQGCPPNNALVVQTIIGGRAQAKRRYADKPLEETEA